MPPFRGKPRPGTLSFALPMTTMPVLALALAVSAGISTAPPPRPGPRDQEAALLKEATGLHPEALHAALASWDALHTRGDVTSELLSVIDYGLPSTAKRMWVFDLASGRILFNDLVAHGRNSGEDVAECFSNDDGSYMSSLGAFVTGGAYDGKNGYSLHLRGTEAGINDRAEARAIVMHGAWYVSDDLARERGRIGRSLGCPAVRPEVAHPLIDMIKDGSVLFVWHPSLGR